MAEHDKDPPWLANVVQQLDASARDLDAATLSRLNRARQQALSAAAPNRRRWFLLAPVLATAAALALAIGLAWRAPEPMPKADPAQDFAMLAEGQDLDLYADLEFYAWLDAQPSSDAWPQDWDQGS